MYVVGGTTGNSIAKDIAHKLNCSLARTVMRRFPDNEFYFRILDDISNKSVLLVQSAYPDEKIIELLLMQNAVVEAGAKKIGVVIPYLGYSRQDKKFENGEPISVKAIAEHLSLHAEFILTVDPHKDHILDFFSPPAYSCSAITEIAQYLKKRKVDFILAPDKGAKERARQASKIMNCSYDYLEKKRIDGKTVEIKPKYIEVKNKTVAIIDDIISTGGTMAQSIKELKKQGAKEVLVACTHGLFIRGAKEKLLAAGCDDIIAADTIENEFNKVKTAPCMIEMIQRYY